ncbi:MAG: phosphoribosylanthranilate isomerase [Pseudomonadota bacterium]
MIRVKICGLRTRAEVDAVARAGAAYAGFVFHPASPRSVTLGDVAWIGKELPDGIKTVALTVDPDDEILQAILGAFRADLIQLHGSETPERVAAIRKLFGKPVIKAVGIADEEDLIAIDQYASVADQILVDARPKPDSDRPGGHGLPFDWRLLEGRRWRRPWMLAGGLSEENVGEAIRVTGAKQVDVSSGVERSPGHKDPEKVAAFVAAAKSG